MHYEEHVQEKYQSTASCCDRIAFVIISGMFGAVLGGSCFGFVGAIGIGCTFALAAVWVSIVAYYCFAEDDIIDQFAANHLKIDNRHLTLLNSAFEMGRFASPLAAVVRRNNIRTLSIEGCITTIDVTQFEDFYLGLCCLHDNSHDFCEEDCSAIFRSLFGIVAHHPPLRGAHLHALPLFLLAMPNVDNLDLTLLPIEDLGNHHEEDCLNTYSFSCSKLHSSDFKRPCQIVHSNGSIAFTIDVREIPQGGLEALPLAGSTPLSLCEHLADLPYIEEVHLTCWGMELPIYLNGIKSNKLIGMIRTLEESRKSAKLCRTCLECCLKGRARLDISHQGLDQLPDIFPYLDHLEYVVISHNPLKCIPEALLRLPKLKSLIADSCQIGDLPMELANCNCLTALALQDNQFRHFPEVILEMVALRELSISYDFQQDPHAVESLCSLTHLERLNIGSSNLVSLPEKLAGLTKLQLLNLECNQLETIPSPVLQLPELRELNLQGNPIKALPDAISETQNLSRLQLPDFNSEKLPEIVYKIKGLQKLSVKLMCHSSILLKLTKAFPKLIKVSFIDFNFQWKQQEGDELSLQVRSNQNHSTSPAVVASPVDFTTNFHALCLRLEEWKTDNPLFQKACKSIRSAYLLRRCYLVLANMALSELPDIFDFFPWLQKLYLMNNKLTALPPSLQKCSNLELLELTNNRLNSEKIFPIITKLRKLNSLVLSGNTIPYVPGEIKHLSRLRKLEMNKCQLAAISPELWQCPVLSELQFQLNHELRSLPVGFENLHLLSVIKLGGTKINPDVQARISKQCKKQLQKSLLYQTLENWVKLSNEVDEVPSIFDLDETQCQSLKTWLTDRLETSKDFEYAPSRALLASRALQIIDTAMKDKTFHDQFFAQLENGNTGCGDMGAMGFNIVNLLWELHHAGNIPTHERLKLMVRAAKTLALRLELQELINSYQGAEFGESVEIFLYYEVHLQKRLDLLTFYQHILYPSLGHHHWVDERALQAYVKESYVFQLIDLPGFDAVAGTDEIYKNKKEKADNLDPDINENDYGCEYDYIEAIEGLGRKKRERSATLARELVERSIPN